MQLVQRSLRGRAFALQFQQIMAEFGDEIPWLRPVQPIIFVTNPTYFEEQLVGGLGCQDRDEVTAFQFVTSTRASEFVGGMIHIARSPEHFASPENQVAMDRLVRDGHHFISCIQIRGPYQGMGHGRELFRRALASVLEKYGKAWGVVSTKRMLAWYLSLGLGITAHSSPNNPEHLWILSWG